MKILGICGSLRQGSSNALLLKAAQNELIQHEWISFDLSKLPYFDPDNQYSDETPEVVLDVRRLTAEADVIFVATPEYASGMPGVLKNGFEWIFHEGTQRKNIFVVIGSVQGESTKRQLIEVLSTMDFSIDENHVFIVKGARSIFDANGSLKESALKTNFLQFCQSVEVSRS